MRDAVPGQAIEMLADRLARARQHQRSAAEHRAQENLQAAVAADVVEGAPYHRRIALLRLERRRQGGERVHHHFRHARGARRQQYPFGRVGRRDKPIRRHDIRPNIQRGREVRRPHGPAFRHHRPRHRPRRRRTARQNGPDLHRAARSSGGAQRRRARSAPRRSSIDLWSRQRPISRRAPRGGRRGSFRVSRLAKRALEPRSQRKPSA